MRRRPHLAGACLGGQRLGCLGKPRPRPRARVHRRSSIHGTRFRSDAGLLASARDGRPHRRAIGESRIGPFAPRHQSRHDYATGEFVAGTRAAARESPVSAGCRPSSEPGLTNSSAQTRVLFLGHNTCGHDRGHPRRASKTSMLRSSVTHPLRCSSP